jgi:hypothetical protein
MTCEAEVTAARNIRDALIVIARHVDALPQPGTRDDWTGNWQTLVPTTEPGAQRARTRRHRDPRHDHPNEVAVAQGPPQPGDRPGDPLALEAELRLLTDDGAPGPTPADDGVVHIDEAGNFTIPGTNPERQLARYRWALRVGLHEYLGSEWESDEAAATFAAGGPLWLHSGNRQAVMGLPYEARQWLVEEVGADSVQEAQELSRDILKFDDNTSTLDITQQAVEDGAVSNGR